MKEVRKTGKILREMLIKLSWGRQYVPTCQFNSRIVGNLREQPFAQLWQSAATDEQRRWVRGCPGCWAECEVLPNAVYSLDLLRNPKTPG